MSHYSDVILVDLDLLENRFQRCEDVLFPGRQLLAGREPLAVLPPFDERQGDGARVLVEDLEDLVGQLLRLRRPVPDLRFGFRSEPSVVHDLCDFVECVGRPLVVCIPTTPESLLDLFQSLRCCEWTELVRVGQLRHLTTSTNCYVVGGRTSAPSGLETGPAESCLSTILKSMSSALARVLISFPSIKRSRIAICLAVRYEGRKVQVMRLRALWYAFMTYPSVVRPWL